MNTERGESREWGVDSQESGVDNRESGVLRDIIFKLSLQGQLFLFVLSAFTLCGTVQEVFPKFNKANKV